MKQTTLGIFADHIADVNMIKNQFSNTTDLSLFEVNLSSDLKLPLAPNRNKNYVLFHFRGELRDYLPKLTKFRQKNPKHFIIVKATFKNANCVVRFLQLGAIGCIALNTSPTLLPEIVATIERKGSYLSPEVSLHLSQYFMGQKESIPNLTAKQTQIVRGVVDGLTYKSIGEQLCISVNTVCDHIRTIYRKLNVNSKAELVRRVMASGVLLPTC